MSSTMTEGTNAILVFCREAVMLLLKPQTLRDDLASMSINEMAGNIIGISVAYYVLSNIIKSACKLALAFVFAAVTLLASISLVRGVDMCLRMPESCRERLFGY
ncbi:hypothetical protein QBC39DRAFT_358138 [Podospora conica]|nr:hypothetical protein QBC39DRAFT_358138 [Schizothecium conicum]